MPSKGKLVPLERTLLQLLAPGDVEVAVGLDGDAVGTDAVGAGDWWYSP